MKPSRLEINVHYSQKDRAKSLGAQWDKHKKTWYVPEGEDITKFSEWFILAKETNHNIESNRFGITKSSQTCWKCKKETNIHGFILPPENRTITEVDNSEITIEMWFTNGEAIFPHYIVNINKHPIEAIKAITENYAYQYSRTDERHYWMNTCEHCHSNQGDFYIYQDANSPFSNNTFSKNSYSIIAEYNYEFHCKGAWTL